MAQQNDWKYCETTTKQHSLAVKFRNCVELIHDISVAEGSRKSPFVNELALNLDKLETEKCIKDKRDAFATMDIAFGVERDDSGKRKVERFVLCEYRLRYKNVNNIKKGDLDSKINYSKRLLGNSPALHDKYIFVFSSGLKAQAYSRLRRLYNNKACIEVFDLNELKAVYF